MPTYEYRCPVCEHEFEKIQRMSDEPRADCPACGKEATRLISGGAGLLFKGSGFYTTDYRSESYKKAAGAERGSDKGSSDKGSTETGGSEKKKSGSGEAGVAKDSPSGKSESTRSKPKAE